MVTAEDELISGELGISNVEEVVKESGKVAEIADDLDLEEASQFDFLAYLESKNVKYKKPP